jgi:hypothetical protein
MSALLCVGVSFLVLACVRTHLRWYNSLVNHSTLDGWAVAMVEIGLLSLYRAGHLLKAFDPANQQTPREYAFDILDWDPSVNASKDKLNFAKCKSKCWIVCLFV